MENINEILNSEIVEQLADMIPNFDPEDPSTYNALSRSIPGFNLDRAETYPILESAVFNFNQLKSVVSMAKDMRGHKVNMEDYWIFSAYSSLFTKVTHSRRKMFHEIQKISSFYLVDVIIEQITSDALTPDVITGNILTLYSENTEIDKELKELEERLKIDSLAEIITPDMLLYGDYILSTVIEPGKGIVELLDNVEQDKIVPLNKNLHEVNAYLVENADAKLTVAEPANYVLFSLAGRKQRIDLQVDLKAYTKDQQTVFARLPRYIRIGKSFIYTIIEKLKELELLEKLVPATKLSKLASGNLIGVQVPASTEPEKAFTAARRIEGLINKKIGIDTSTGEMSLSSIIASAGRIKVVPTFSDGKGDLNKLDYKSDEPGDLLNSVTELRNTVFSSAGIPPEIIFGSDGGESKGELLKKYARYLRLLKRVQKSVVNAVKEIAYIHLTNKGVTFEEKDIQIDFLNKLVDIDNIDKLEFMDTTLGFVKTAKEFIDELSESPDYSDNVNKEAFVTFLADQLDTIGLTNIITTDENENEDTEIQG